MRRAGTLARMAAIACTLGLAACSWLFGLDPDEYASQEADAAAYDAPARGDERSAVPPEGDAARSLHLYVLGGSVPIGGSLQNTIPTDKVYFAPITADGDVGPFRETTRLPVPLRSHVAVAHRGYVYVLGGESNQAPESDVVYAAEVLPSGELGAWVESGPRLPGARKLHAAAVLGDRVYVFGGLGASGRFGDVLAAELSSGSTGPFVEVAQLDAPTFALAAAAAEDRLWALGGVGDDTTTRATTLSFVVHADGGVSGPTTGPSLLDGGACYHAAALSGASLLTVGAVKNGLTTVTREVAIATLEEDGRITGFRATTPLPASLWSHAVATAGGHVYVTGGLGPNAKPRYDHVLVGSLSDDPLVWKESRTRLPQSLAAHASVVH